MRIAVERAGRRRTTGAGKSTLIKIVAGVHRRGSGELLLDGEPVDFSSTAESKAAGVAVIYQEPTLFPDLSVTSEPQSGRRAGSAQAGESQVTLRSAPIGTGEAHWPQNKAGWAARRPASRTTTGDQKLPLAAVESTT